MTAEPTPKVKSLYKALHLLDYFDQDHPDAGVTELAEYSGLLKSSVHNILQTFELCGYVTQSSETSRYMLGGAAVSLFSRFKATRKIDYRITEYLQSLRDMFHKNVYFAAKEQDAAVYLCAEQSFNHTGSPLSKEGAHAPLHATSLGKVLLGYSTVKEKEAFLRTGLLTAYTPQTTTDPDALRAELERVIYDGYEPVHYAIGIGSDSPISPYQRKQYLSELRYVAKKVASIVSGKW